MSNKFTYPARRGMTLGLAVGQLQVKALKRLEQADTFVGETEAQALRASILSAAAQYEAHVAAAGQEHWRLAQSNLFEFAVIRSVVDIFVTTAASTVAPKAMQALQVNLLKTLKNSFAQVGNKVAQAINEGAQV